MKENRVYIKEAKNLKETIAKLFQDLGLVDLGFAIF